MQQVIEITAPFFGLIFLGTFLKSIKFLNEEKTTFLSRFAFYVLMPVMLFSNISKTSFNGNFDFKFIIKYEFVTILIIFLFVCLGLSLKKSLPRSTIIGLNAAYPNYGYIGIPMCIFAFGIEASLPLGLILLADTIVLLSFTSLFISLSERTSTYSEIVKNLIKRIVSQPLLIAVCLGMFFSLLNIKPINTLDKFIDMIASAAAPVALIALGASIKFNFQKNENLELVMISLGKLIIHPFLLILIFLIWPSEKNIWIQTAILCSCLPIAANVFVLAQYYGHFQKQSANAIVLSTVISTFTVPITLYIIFHINF